MLADLLRQRRWGGALLVVLLMTAAPARAQAPLMLVDGDTEVDEISFTFVESQTFREHELGQEIALQEPGFYDKIRSILPLVQAPPHPFDPLVLQRDVVRLRRFYERQGFLDAEVSYPASQLDTSSNTIHVIFRIREGPPLVIQDVSFADSLDQTFAAALFSGEVRENWIEFRDDHTFQTGERYTTIKFFTLQGQILAWLRGQGFAFADVEADSTVYRENNSIDLLFRLDPGPRARISEINIEGNETVSDDVILRELPFAVGERFDGDELIEGQRNLFALAMFRIAVVDVPEQPQDSTVAIRISLQEADLRSVSGRAGYDTEQGGILQTQWTHRNLFGGARHFTVSGVYGSGFGARRVFLNRIQRRVRIAASLRQPYLFSSNLTGIVSPFFLHRNDELLDASEFGIISSLIYEIYPFRIVSLEYTFSRAIDVSEPPVDSLLNEEIGFDVYDKSIFTLAASLGRVDNFLSPQSGFIIQPFVETSRPALGSRLNYHKLGVEANYYQPVLENVDLRTRLTLGRIFRFGESKYDESAILDDMGRIDIPCRDIEPVTLSCKEEVLETFRKERRFQPIRFYAGGANDVRGWSARLVGAQIAVADTLIRDDDPETVPDTIYGYEPLGGIAKISGSVEVALPLPFFGPSWGSALFVDFGQVFDSKGPGNALDYRPLRFGIGAGLRYETIVGDLRIDLGFKVNPDRNDLLSAEDVYNFNAGLIDELNPSFWDRFQVHISLGQAL